VGELHPAVHSSCASVPRCSYVSLCVPLCPCVFLCVPLCAHVCSSMSTCAPLVPLFIPVVAVGGAASTKCPLVRHTLRVRACGGWRRGGASQCCGGTPDGRGGAEQQTKACAGCVGWVMCYMCNVHACRVFYSVQRSTQIMLWVVLCAVLCCVLCCAVCCAVCCDMCCVLCCACHAIFISVSSVPTHGR
jgi:hypothetical protein